MTKELLPKQGFYANLPPVLIIIPFFLVTSVRASLSFRRRSMSSFRPVKAATTKRLSGHNHNNIVCEGSEELPLDAKLSLQNCWYPAVANVNPKAIATPARGVCQREKLLSSKVNSKDAAQTTTSVGWDTAKSRKPNLASYRALPPKDCCPTSL